ncbi:hypothetical protein K7432_013602, partial [Basidiobolus ranarum]
MSSSQELDKMLDELQLSVSSYSDKPAKRTPEKPTKQSNNKDSSFLSEMEKEFDKIYLGNSVSTEGDINQHLSELDTLLMKSQKSHSPNGVSRSLSRKVPSDREDKYSPSRNRTNGSSHSHSRHLQVQPQHAIFRKSLVKLDDDQETIHEPSSDEEEKHSSSKFSKSKSSVKIESVTVDDYGDLDDLIKNLDRFLHGKTKRARSRLSVINPPTSKSHSARAHHHESERSHRPTTGKSEGSVEGASEKHSGHHQAHNEEKAKIASQKLREMNITKFAVRIYIDDADHFEIVYMTSLTTAETLIADMQEKNYIDNNDQWTLFELANDYGIERPLRDWDVISETIESWESN